jgi:[ribosomal protein S5]-alanine N-acetyltransferase
MKIAISPNLELSAFQPADAKELAVLANDRAIYDMTMDLPHPYTLSDAMDWITFNRELSLKYHRVFSYAIRNAEGQLLGSIGRRMAYGFTSHQDEIGYWVGSAFRRQGVMTAALSAYLRHLQDNEGLERISALVFPDNTPSIRLLEGAGFAREGHLHRYLIKDRQFKDVLLYAIW